jgi:Dolichyl-phosphate-mannose-protein mannosyltransferase
VTFRLPAWLAAAALLLFLLGSAPIDWAALTHPEADPELYDIVVMLLLRAAAGVVLVVSLAVLAAHRFFAGSRIAIAAGLRLLRHDLRAFLRDPDAVPLAVMTLFALALRARYLWQPVRTDEAATFFYYASKPLPFAISVYGSPNNHLLHTLLVHFFYAIFGDVPAMLRLPSLIAGTLMVPATYAAARQLFRESDRGVALVAAALVAGFPVLIDYGSIARGYSLLVLAFLCCLALLARALENGDAASWLLFAVCGAIGFWSVPVMLYAYGALVAWALAEIAISRRGRRIRALAASVFITGVLTFLVYLPVLLVSGVEALIANPFVHAQSGLSLLSDGEHGLWAIGRMWGFGLPSAVIIAMWALALLGAFRPTRFRIPFWIGVPLFIVPLLLVQRIVPYRRTWLFLLPLLLMLGAAGPQLLLRRYARVAAWAIAIGLAATVLAGNSVYFSPEAGSFRDAEGTARFLQSRLREGDVVIATVPSDVPLIYWFHRLGVPDASLRRDPATARRMFVVVNSSERQTLDFVLREKGIAADPRNARRVRVAESGVVYEVKR